MRLLRIYHLLRKSPSKSISLVAVRSNSTSAAAASAVTSDDRFPILSAASAFVDTVSPRYAEIYRRNHEHQSAILQHKSRAAAGGGERAIKRHTEVNKKLLVRQRLQLLLDRPSSPEETTTFFEFGSLAGCHGLEYGEVPSAGVVAGIGTIRGRRCMIMANDATVKGGTVYPITVKKQLRGQEIAQQLRIPCIYVVDSGGAFLPLQRDIFPDRNHGGRVFHNEAVMGAMGIPQIALVCGSCTAGAAYIPTMADDAVIVDRIGSVFLGGPPLVRAALGEVVTTEELGGATLHCRTSGCTDYFAENERVAFAMCRDIVESLSDDSSSPTVPSPRFPIEEPLFSPSELIGIDHDDGDGNLFVYRLLGRVLDGSRFREFRQAYGSSLIVGFARLGGRLVGIVAHNGVSIDERSAQKACQLVQMCDNRRLPVVFFQNTRQDGWTPPGVNEEESARTIKSVAALMSAVATTNSYKITVNVGDSFGSDYFALCGRSFDPAFSFMWPNASVGTCRPSSTPSNPEEVGIDPDQCSALYAASHLWVDDVILPQDTRRVLIQCLQCLPRVEARGDSPSVSRSIVRM